MVQTVTVHTRLVHIAAVPVAALIVASLLLLAGWGGPPAGGAVRMAGAVGFPSFALVSAAMAARRGRGRPRRAWAVMTVGLIAVQIAAVVAIYHRYWRGSVEPLSPATALIGFSVLTVIGCVTVLMFPASYPGLARVRMLLDGAIFAAALFVVAWLGLLAGVYSSTTVSYADKLLAIACSVSGVVTVAVLVLARTTTEWRLSMTTLTASLILITATGNVYVYLLPRHAYVIDSPLGFSWWTRACPIG